MALVMPHKPQCSLQLKRKAVAASTVAALKGLIPRDSSDRIPKAEKESVKSLKIIAGSWRWNLSCLGVPGAPPGTRLRHCTLYVLRQAWTYASECSI